jgi:hypothetical protein
MSKELEKEIVNDLEDIEDIFNSAEALISYDGEVFESDGEIELKKQLKLIQSEISSSPEQIKLLNLLPTDLIQVLTNNGAFIAGGAITSVFCERDINDIDIFFPNEEVLEKVKEYCFSNYEFKSYHESDNAYTFIELQRSKYPIQFIKLNYISEPINIFKHFDFTVCCGLYDFKKEKFEFHTDFLKHNAQRKLVYISTNTYPIMSVLRAEKYKKLGYTLSNIELIKILFKISSLNIKTKEDFFKQITGFYLTGELEEIIKNVDNKKELDELEVHSLIDKLSFTYKQPKSEKPRDLGRKGKTRPHITIKPFTLKKEDDSLPF